MCHVTFKHVKHAEHQLIPMSGKTANYRFVFHSPVVRFFFFFFYMNPLKNEPFIQAT